MPKKVIRGGFVEQVMEAFGEEVFERDEENVESIEAISTGSISLDIATGVGGIPRGRFTEIFGPESSAKTSLSLSVAKHVTGKTLYIDPEIGLTYSYIRAIVGEVDEDKFVLVQPESMEQSLSIAERGIRSGEFDLIVLDSIGALAPEKEAEKEIGEATVALVSRALANFLRRNAFAVRENNVAFIFINQIRDKIGGYGGGESTPGGHALKHYTSMRVRLSRAEDIAITKKVNGKDTKEVIGLISAFTIRKNKVGIPLKTGTFPFMFRKGIDTEKDAVDFALMLGVIERHGAYYAYEGNNLALGFDKTTELLKENTELLDKIVTQCYNLTRSKNIESITERSEVEDNKSTAVV